MGGTPTGRSRPKMHPEGVPDPPEREVRDIVRDARFEGALAMLVALGLLVTNAVVSRAQGWQLAGVPWWTWLIIALPETMLLVALVVSALGDVRPGRLRDLVVVLLGLLTLGSLTATGLLLWALGTSDMSAGQLALNALVVWLTNLIVFGLLFWELDGGGPLRRVAAGRLAPDLQFPQDINPEIAAPSWHPRLLDYLYVSLTNSLAVSPTDAMPLSRRAKSLMGLESVISYVIVVLFIARAVNILGP